MTLTCVRKKMTTFRKGRYVLTTALTPICENFRDIAAENYLELIYHDIPRSKTR